MEKMYGDVVATDYMSSSGNSVQDLIHSEKISIKSKNMNSKINFSIILLHTSSYETLKIITYDFYLSACNICDFHGGDYEGCRLLAHKIPVHTSQETLRFSYRAEPVNAM
jgi:hypothetical protein